MWQVIGQDRIVSLLDYSLRTDSVAHAYLLVGPPHVGKGTLALNLAQALNCAGSEPPCGQCHSCQRISEGKHADVVPVGLDSRAEIGIDEIVSLQRLANLPPYEGRCKVFIIDDADYLSTEAANSLLKILEEPPPRVVWILLTADRNRLLPTIVSRCQALELKVMSPERVQEVLVHSYNVEADKARLLTRLCHGRLGWALSALRNDAMLQQRSQRMDKLASLLTASLEQRFACAQELAAELSRDRKAGSEIVESWLDWWRDLMLIKGGCREAIINVDYEAALEEQARRLNLSEIKQFLAKLGLLQQAIARNVNHRLAVEWLMLNLPGKEDARHIRKPETKDGKSA